MFANEKWAASWQNQQNGMCAPVWLESSQCAQWVVEGLMFLQADSEDWSDWADAQADLSPCLAHSHFVGFVMAAQMYLSKKSQYSIYKGEFFVQF